MLLVFVSGAHCCWYSGASGGNYCHILYYQNVQVCRLISTNNDKVFMYDVFTVEEKNRKKQKLFLFVTFNSSFTECFVQCGYSLVEL